MKAEEIHQEGQLWWKVMIRKNKQKVVERMQLHKMEKKTLKRKWVVLAKQQKSIQPIHWSK